MIQITKPVDREAVALAACYRLLLQKAAERRARLQTQATAESEQRTAENINQQAEREA